MLIDLTVSVALLQLPQILFRKIIRFKIRIECKFPINWHNAQNNRLSCYNM